MSWNKLLWILPLLFLSKFTHAADLSMKCSVTGTTDTMRDAKLWSEKKGKTYSIHLQIDRTIETQKYSLEDLQCVANENPAAFHCWNDRGAAVDLVSDYKVGYAYEEKTPQAYKIKSVVKHNFTFRFHDRPWAESGRDAHKFQHMPFDAKNCELKLK